VAKPDKDRKIGHRRVDDAGQVTYKKVSVMLHLLVIAVLSLVPVGYTVATTGERK